ncbi:putative RNA-directed DNA polymerase [Tanacetum coccineum]
MVVEDVDPDTRKPKKNKGQASNSEELKLSDYDPLYLHANDSNGNPIISFKLEGIENYKVWSATLKLALHTKNKLGFINGKCERPTDDYVLRQEQWDRCNSVVLSWILGCVTQKLYLGQIYFTNAKVVWDELAETYSKTDGSVIYNMHYKIQTFTQSEKLKSHNQFIRLMQFLMDLDDVFSNVRSNILITEPLPDVKYAFATLSRDESYKINSIHSVVNKIGSTNAFVSKSNNDWSANRPNQINQNKRFSRGPNLNLVCKNCNMVGHTIDRCFELIGYPVGLKKNPKGNNTKANVNNVTTCGSSNSHILTSDGYQKLMGLLRSSGSNTACDIRNVTCIPLECNLVFCFASCRLFNLNTNISTYSTYIGWIIDSGASQHMTYSALFLFNVIDVSHLNITVAHPNGTVAKVNQVGSFQLTGKLVIHDVLVVPEYHVSLLSVHKLTSANKLSVIFNELDCLIQDSTQNYLVGTGSMSGGLYFLDQGRYPKDDGTRSAIHLASTRDKNVQNSDKEKDKNSTGSIIANENSGQLDATSNDETYKSEVKNLGILTCYLVQMKVIQKAHSESYSFETNLNKSIEPKTYKEASTDERWVEAMNKEIEALNRNNT